MEESASEVRWSMVGVSLYGYPAADILHQALPLQYRSTRFYLSLDATHVILLPVQQ